MAEYRYNRHAQVALSPVEQFTLHPVVNGRQVRPCWPNQRHPLIVRILPSLGEDGQPKPYRYSAEPNDFTDWLRSFPCARGFGLQQRRTIIVADPSADPPVDPSQHPYWVLQRVIDRAERQGTLRSDVQRYLGMYRTYHPLHKPVSMGYALCLVYGANGEWFCSRSRPPRGWSPTDPVQVLEMPCSALVELEHAMNAKADAEAAASGDWERGFVCGDITDVRRGAFLCIYDPKRVQLPSELREIVWRSEPDAQRDRRVANYYALAVARKLVVNGQEITAKLPNWQQVLADLPSLGQVVRILSHEEAAEVIAQAFIECPGFLEIGWRGYPQFFTPRVRQLLSSAAEPAEADDVFDEPMPRSKAGRTAPAVHPEQRPLSEDAAPVAAKPTKSRQQGPAAASSQSAFLQSLKQRRAEFEDPDPRFDAPEEGGDDETEAVDDDGVDSPFGPDEVEELEREISQRLLRPKTQAEIESASGDEDLPRTPSIKPSRQTGQKSKGKLSAPPTRSKEPDEGADVDVGW